MVRYKSEDQVAVKEIHEIIKNKQSRATSVKYEEAEAREYLKSLLDSQGIEYKEEKGVGGIWIKWYPESKEQEKEIEMKVVQYIFDLKAKEK